MTAIRENWRAYSLILMVMLTLLSGWTWPWGVIFLAWTWVSVRSGMVFFGDTVLWDETPFLFGLIIFVMVLTCVLSIAIDAYPLYLSLIK